MQKSNFLENVDLFRDKLSITQIVGLFGVIFYLHILGIRENIEPVGFVFNNPINAGYVLTDIALTFAWAYLFDAILTVLLFGFDEAANAVRAKWTGTQPKIIVSSESDFDYAYGTWRSRIILTIVFYSFLTWIIGLTVILLIFIMSFISRRLRRPETRDDRYGDLSEDEHRMSVTYLKRALLGAYIGLACIIAYTLGLSRIDHLQYLRPTVMAYSQGNEYKGKVIYSLSSSYVLYDNENDKYVVLPHSDTVVQAPPVEEPTSTSSGDT